MSTIPARAFGLPGGTLSKGAAADIVVIDPTAHWKVDPSLFLSKSRNTPFSGWDLVGKVELTMVGGRTVYSAPAVLMRRDTARQIADCCRALYEAGLIAGADGNIAVRVGADRALVTPSGILKSGLTADDIVEVSLTGDRIRGHRTPSSELDMHLRILKARQDVNAVVHAHPPVTTGFGVAGLAFDDCVLPELIYQMGHVPLVPYGTPGTPDLGEAVEPYCRKL